MINDDLIWSVINPGFCSHKVKTECATFCKYKYNVTGVCNKVCCPLANCRYATVLEEKGKLNLYIKEIERAHLPSKLWDTIELSDDSSEARQQIKEYLKYWPKTLVTHIQQRRAKLTEVLKKIERLSKKNAPKLVTIKKKMEKRNRQREIKALRQSKIEEGVKQELLNRLREGIYDEAYPNLQRDAFEKMIEKDIIEEEEVEYVLDDIEEAVEDIEDMGT